MNKRTPEDWYGASLGEGLLPASWQSWSDSEVVVFQSRSKFEREMYAKAYGVEPGDLILRAVGSTVPYELNASNMTKMLAAVLRTAPDDPAHEYLSPLTREAVLGALAHTKGDDGGALTDAERDQAFRQVVADERIRNLSAESIVRLFGPLFPAAWGSPDSDMFMRGKSLEFVPRPPLVVGMRQLLRQMLDLREAILIVQALQEGNSETLGRLVTSFATRGGVSISRLADMVRAFPPEDARAFHIADGPDVAGHVGAALMWLRWSATETAMPLTTRRTPSGDHQLIPKVSAPGQVLWLSLAHAAGAITLPYGRGNTPLVSFCADCGAPVYSLRPRNRGQNVFCDPPEGATRSVCGNRYHSRRAKRRARESAEA